MNADQRQHLNPKHQQETVSTASLQSFEDPEGGVPLDSPVIKAREQRRCARPANFHSVQPDTGNKPN
jgi:hypothetical protein